MDSTKQKLIELKPNHLFPIFIIYIKIDFYYTLKNVKEICKTILLKINTTSPLEFCLLKFI